MKKDDQNSIFEVWLSTYGNRLIEVARNCSPEAEPSQKKPAKAVTDSGAEGTTDAGVS